MVTIDPDLDHGAEVSFQVFPHHKVTLTIGLEPRSPVGFLNNKAEIFTSIGQSMMSYFPSDSILEKRSNK